MVSNEFFTELEIEGQDSPCSYLPGRTARMVYRLAYHLSAERYEQLLSRGWRRFGRTLFRPVCSACCECRSLRVDLQAFRPSRWQRRCLNRIQGVELIIQKPTVTEEHLELYNRYHADMHIRRQWPIREITEEEYSQSFLDGRFSFAREFQYRHEGKLIALGLVDTTPNVMSSIYFFHEPSWRDQSPGTYSVLREIADGQQHGRRWLYMGYYIRDCGSMNYKNRFRPHELLESYVDDQTAPVWTLAAEDKDEPTA